MSTGSIDCRFLVERGDFRLDVDFSAPATGITGVFGASGAGKTTLLRCIAGLERADEARLVVDGECIDDGGRRRAIHRRRVAVVFQEPRLFPHLDVAGNIRYGARRAAGSSAVDHDELVALLGLDRLLSRRPQNLSGGEAQRVAIARALLSSPRLLLLDEPLAALDRPRRNEIMPYLEALHATLSVPAFYVSHREEEMLRLADHLLLLDHGRVVQSGSLAVLAADATTMPGTSPVAVLAGVAGQRDPLHGLTDVETPAGTFQVTSSHAPGSSLRLLVAASDVSVSLEPPAGSSIQNVLPAAIKSIEATDEATAILVLECEHASLYARVTRRAVAELSLESGRRVYAGVKATAVGKAGVPASVPIPA
jgi:molybdate transport system ATP-binding protein